MRAFATKYPLNRLYRVGGGVHSASSGLAPLGVIIAYTGGTGGNPPAAGVVILGFKGAQEGSAEKPLWVPGEGLEDVTEAARKGALPELRQ